MAPSRLNCFVLICTKAAEKRSCLITEKRRIQEVSGRGKPSTKANLVHTVVKKMITTIHVLMTEATIKGGQKTDRMVIEDVMIKNHTVVAVGMKTMIAVIAEMTEVTIKENLITGRMATETAIIKNHTEVAVTMITMIVVIAGMTEITIKKDQKTDRTVTETMIIKSHTEVVAAMIMTIVVITEMIKENLTSHMATKEEPLIKRVPARNLSEVMIKGHTKRGMKGRKKSVIQKRLQFGLKENDSIKEGVILPCV
jgi:hypothetical protein